MIKHINRILHVFNILNHSKGGFKYLFSSGASLASFKILKALTKHVSQISTIIDVGANVGQFALATQRFYPEAQIFSFEPVPESFDKLQQNVAAHPQIHPYNLALGNAEGKLTFYKNEHSHASSALKVSTFQAEELPETRNYQEIQVDVAKLDNVDLPHSMTAPVLLKLDVQGYEKQVLEGGLHFLDKVDYLLFETSFTPMYENEPLFDEMHQFVKQQGFQILAPVGTLESDGKILQLDMLYQKVK